MVKGTKEKLKEINEESNKKQVKADLLESLKNKDDPTVVQEKLDLFNKAFGTNVSLGNKAPKKKDDDKDKDNDQESSGNENEDDHNSREENPGENQENHKPEHCENCGTELPEGESINYRGLKVCQKCRDELRQQDSGGNN